MSGITEKILAILQRNPQAFDTPCYVFDPQILASRYLALKQALQTQLVLSLKANSNVDFNLRFMHIGTDGIEVASISELNMVAKSTSGPVFVNNPAMDRNFIRAGLGAKAHFIIDNIAQIRAIVEFAGRRPVNPLMLRLNATVVHRFKPEAHALRQDHFGMDWGSVLEAIDLIRARADVLTLGGLHVFAGSHMFAKASFVVSDAAPEIVRDVESRYGKRLQRINLGGGFHENWDADLFDFAAYRDRLARLPPHLTVMHESGRGVFAPSGAFLTSIVATKRIENQCYAVCDGGMAQSFLLCRTENSFRKRSTPTLFRRKETPGAAPAPLLFVGSTCSRDDLIGESAEAVLPPAPGDICIFDGCGAYHSTYTVSKFLGLKEASSYVIP